MPRAEILEELPQRVGWEAPENATAPDPTEAEPSAAPQVAEGIPASLSVGPVGLEPTTNGLKVHCSAN